RYLPAAAATSRSRRNTAGGRGRRTLSRTARSSALGDWWWCPSKTPNPALHLTRPAFRFPGLHSHLSGPGRGAGWFGGFGCSPRGWRYIASWAFLTLMSWPVSSATASKKYACRRVQIRIDSIIWLRNFLETFRRCQRAQVAAYTVMIPAGSRFRFGV